MGVKETESGKSIRHIKQQISLWFSSKSNDSVVLHLMSICTADQIIACDTFLKCFIKKRMYLHIFYVHIYVYVYSCVCTYVYTHIFFPNHKYVLCI